MLSELLQMHNKKGWTDDEWKILFWIVIKYSKFLNKHYMDLVNKLNLINRMTMIGSLYRKRFILKIK